MSLRIFIRFFCLLLACVVSINAQSTFAQGVADEKTGALIRPDVEPVEVNESLIDTENFELGGYFGVMNVEDFETAIIKGVKLGYHLSEQFLIEANFGFGEAGETSFEKLGNVELLSEDERDYSYYSLGVAYKLPGETYIGNNRSGKNWAFNHNFYISAAMGTTDFGGDKRLTGIVGTMYQLLVNDGFSLQLGVREHFYKIDVVGPEKLSFNTELITGVSFFF